VPKGNVPDEMVFADAAHSGETPPLARVEFKPEDLVTAADTTPQHAAACADLLKKFGIYNDGPFTPWPYHEEARR